MVLDPENGPVMAALLIIEPEKAKEILDHNKVHFYKAGRIPFDKNETEYPEREEMGVLVLEQSLEKSKAIAKDFGLRFFYWMDFDPARFIEVVSVNSNEKELYADGDDN